MSAAGHDDIGLTGTIAGEEGMKTGTLDEPVSVTLMRDLKLVASKLKVVLIPGKTSDRALEELRNWDLWGPLMVCLSLSIMLSVSAPPEQTAMVFTGVFVVIWMGAAVITVNAQLLGSNISFFQSVCVLGYCVFPINIATLLCIILHPIVHHIILRALLVIPGFLWSSRASVLFMSQMIPEERKTLAVYPVFLFYLFISWMVLIQ